MHKTLVKYKNTPCGILEEISPTHYRYAYLPDYQGDPISLTLPIRLTPYDFDSFPAFFDGLLPEGIQLDALLRQRKIDQLDYMAQLIAVGQDLVGAVSIHPLKDEQNG